MEFIDLKRQYQLYKCEIDDAIQRVLNKTNFINGEEILELEHVLAEFVQVEHCIATSSGTDSLLIALMALDLEPGDEVITTPFTWISTSEVIRVLRAVPVFVDIDPMTYNIDSTKIEQAVTARTKAILPVNLFGQMADYSKINDIAKAYNLPVIEDAAQSFGATQNDKLSCSSTTIGCTSFFPAKPFGCYGDGGAIFTNNHELAQRMRAIRNHGGEKRHHHTCIGLNGRMDTLQAAILLAKWPYYQEEIKVRDKIGSFYTEQLSQFYSTPQVSQGNSHIYAQYTIRCPDRNALQQALKTQDIPTAIYYPKCLHEQPAFNDLGYTLGSFPVAELAAKQVLSIPMHPWLTIEEQEQIIDALTAQQCILI